MVIKEIERRLINYFGSVDYDHLYSGLDYMHMYINVYNKLGHKSPVGWNVDKTYAPAYYDDIVSNNASFKTLFQICPFSNIRKIMSSEKTDRPLDIDVIKTLKI